MEDTRQLYEDIYRSTKKKEKKKIETYNKILSGCNRKIKWCNSNNKFECYFEIPQFFMGSPLYNIEECAYFIIQKLQIQKFKTFYYSPDILIQLGLTGSKINDNSSEEKYYKPNGIIFISWMHIKEKIDNKYI